MQGPIIVVEKQIFYSMKTLIVVLLFCILFVMSWPIALALFFLFIIAWVILLPFRILGFTIELIFKIVGGIIMLPFRLIRSI